MEGNSGNLASRWKDFSDDDLDLGGSSARLNERERERERIKYRPGTCSHSSSIMGRTLMEVFDQVLVGDLD